MLAKSHSDVYMNILITLIRHDEQRSQSIAADAAMCSSTWTTIAHCATSATGVQLQLGGHVLGALADSAAALVLHCAAKHGAQQSPVPNVLLKTLEHHTL
jgi:hypothetical protein